MSLTSWNGSVAACLHSPAQQPFPAQERKEGRVARGWGGHGREEGKPQQGEASRTGSPESDSSAGRLLAPRFSHLYTMGFHSFFSTNIYMPDLVLNALPSHHEDKTLPLASLLSGEDQECQGKHMEKLDCFR